MNINTKFTKFVILLVLAVLSGCSTADSGNVNPVNKERVENTAQESVNEMSRLEKVRERGKVICASRNDVPGFGFIEESSIANVGFDIDLCRAVATAVLGDPNAIEIRLITAAERGPTVQSGEVDMLVRTVTWTTSRDAQWGNYAQTMFYDGQGFMVRKDGISSAYELQGATVCVIQGTTTELNLEDFSVQNGLQITPLTFESNDAAKAAYESGQCDAYTNDRSQLAAISTGLTNRDEHTILPETISEEPLGPVVPHGDEQWFDIVKTTMGVLIYSEAYEISSSNVPTAITGNRKVDRLFGLVGSFGQETLGLDMGFAQNVIRSVGNYGEIYDRNLGSGSEINLQRENGRNALWGNAQCTNCPKGGQIYAAPLR